MVLAADAGIARVRAQMFDLGDKSRVLDENMTERDVASVLGGAPQMVELRMCGADTPTPSACKFEMYRDRRYHLEVVFSRADDGVWHVREWSFK